MRTYANLIIAGTVAVIAASLCRPALAEGNMWQVLAACDREGDNCGYKCDKSDGAGNCTRVVGCSGLEDNNGTCFKCDVSSENCTKLIRGRKQAAALRGVRPPPGTVHPISGGNGGAGAPPKRGPRHPVNVSSGLKPVVNGTKDTNKNNNSSGTGQITRRH